MKMTREQQWKLLDELMSQGMNEDDAVNEVERRANAESELVSSPVFAVGDRVVETNFNYEGNVVGFEGEYVLVRFTASEEGASYSADSLIHTSVLKHKGA